jgi:hypothetical protein
MIMDFTIPWTAFSVEAEIEQYGVARLVKAHNEALIDEREAKVRAEAELRRRIQQDDEMIRNLRDSVREMDAARIASMRDTERYGNEAARLRTELLTAKADEYEAGYQAGMKEVMLAMVNGKSKA